MNSLTIDCKQWTIQDVAAYCRVSKRTIERMRNNGELPPATRFGRLVRFDADAIKAWVDSSVEAA